jgi:hypothetical protein
MTKIPHLVSAAFALAALATIAAAPAQAAEVACKTGGAVQGCVAATTAPVVAPAAPIATATIARAAYIAPAPVAVTHAGYTT